MNFRKTAMRAFAASALAVGVAAGAAAAPAAANPDTHLDVAWYMPPTALFVGQNDFCSGTLDYRVEKDPTVERGITLIVSSRGASSPLPSWNENSTCRIEVSTGLYSDVPGYEHTPVDVPSEPTELLRKTYVSRASVDTAIFAVSYLNGKDVRFVPQFSYPGSSSAFFHLP